MANATHKTFETIAENTYVKLVSRASMIALPSVAIWIFLQLWGDVKLTQVGVYDIRINTAVIEAKLVEHERRITQLELITQ